MQESPCWAGIPQTQPSQWDQVSWMLSKGRGERPSCSYPFQEKPTLLLIVMFRVMVFYFLFFLFLVSVLCKPPVTSALLPGRGPQVNVGGRACVGFSALPDCWFHRKTVLSFLLAAVSSYFTFFFLMQLCWPFWKNKPPPGSANSEHAAVPYFGVCLTNLVCNHRNRCRSRANHAAVSCAL